MGTPGDGLTGFQQALLAWYQRHARDLPWRRTRDPYAILVSEIMLQQTQVERVAPKYSAFLQRFPNVRSLAAAPVGEVIRAWAPLGYNLRAVRLHGLARAVVKKHGGELPNSLEAWRALPGIGAYTAAAVVCFAFGQQRAVVDTNVARVLGRVLLGRFGPGPDKAEGEALAGSSLPEGRAALWNQALMDLGATICTARAPACDRCPVAAYCLARPLLADPPSRRRVAERSATYRARASFKGSSRYYRGRIVQALREAQGDGQLSDRELGRRLKADFTEADLPWLESLLTRLQQDGLAELQRHGARIWVRLPG